eukprot:6408561-Amphidinium_carterae.1
MAKHFEEVDEDVASYAASQPNLNGPVERNSACGRPRQGGGLQLELDREVPGPASPLFKNRRHVMLS